MKGREWLKLEFTGCTDPLTPAGPVGDAAENGGLGMSEEDNPAREAPANPRGRHRPAKKDPTDIASAIAALSPEDQALLKQKEQEIIQRALKGAVSDRDKTVKKLTRPGSKWKRKP